MSPSGSICTRWSHPSASAIVATAVAITLLGPAAWGTEYPRPGVTERISVTSDGLQAEQEEQWAFPVVAHCGAICRNALSANGRFVAFESVASDLVPGDTNLAVDIFVRDLRKNATERVSISSEGTEGVGFCTPSGFSGNPEQLPGALAGSFEPSISASGRYVVFSSCAQNLVTVDVKHTQDIFVHDRKTGETSLVSAAADDSPALCVGGAGCNRASGRAISGNGRYVTFYSNAPNLVSGDLNNAPDVFVKDLRTSGIELASMSADGTIAEFGVSGFPVISAKGRHVAFRSTSNNLVSGDLNVGVYDVFVHNRKTNEIEIVNVTPDGRQEYWTFLREFMVFTPGQPALSANGRYVAFASRSSGFVPNDINDTFDVFVVDRTTRRIERVSLQSDGREGAAFSEDNMTFSHDGRFVAFWTEARLVPDDDEGGTCKNPHDISNLCTPEDRDVYVYDRHTGAIDLVSRSFDGTTEECKEEGAPCHSALGSMWPSLDASGRLVAFYSWADRLVRGDTNGLNDGFVRDRGDPLKVGGLLAPGAERRLVLVDAPGFSDTGLTRLSDERSDSTTLRDGTDIIGATFAYRPQYSDLYVKIDVDHMPGPRGGIAGLPAAGNPGIVYGLRFTADGIRYEVRIGRSGILGEPGRPVFGLFRCEPTCIEVAELNGGYGTVGESVVTALPLHTIGLEEGGRIEHTEAFSAYGTYLGGPHRVLDVVT